MHKERIVLSSKSVGLAEYKTYLLLENRVCYYGAPNANGVSLSLETAEQYAQTLVDMPVYAKYVPNMNGDPSFGGHEAYLDEDGEVAFDTIAIGVHTSVDVRPDVVETAEGKYETLPCLFATQKIWTRNKNIVAAVKRLFSEGKLYNSWEISYDTCRYVEGGQKELIDYTFEGNCFLGVDNFNFPAYGPDAKVISLSDLQKSDAAMLVATAVAKDVAEANMNDEEGGEQRMNIDEKMVENEEAEVNTSVSEANEDQAVEAQGNEASVEVVPESAEEESEVAEESEGAESEVETVEASEDEQEASEAEEEAPAEETSDEAKEDEQDELEEKDNASATIEVLTDRLAEMAKTLRESQDEIERLNSALEKYLAAEKETKIAELKKYVQDSGCFSEDEIEGEEISSLISSLDKARLAEMIADRTVEAVRKNSEVSDKKSFASVSVSISSDGEEKMDSRAIMHKFLY